MMQLSLFDLAPQPEPTVLRYPNPRKAEHLRSLAQGLQPTIEAKRNPAIAQQRPTRRRANIIAGLRREAECLMQLQSYLHAMADAAEQGELPDILRHITTRTQLEVLVTLSRERWRDAEIERIFTNPNGAYTDWLKRLHRAKITRLSQVKLAIATLHSLHQPIPKDPKVAEIEELERNLIGANFPGYFPTPRPVCDHMVQLAELEEGMRVSEPSAGKGTLAEAIREAANIQLEVCEIQPLLRRILMLKGFNLIGANFLQDVQGQSYHRILLNPPFGRGKEIVHIRHAYNCLIQGGRMVAIAPESITYRQNRNYREFREWLEEVCYLNEPLPDQTFLASDRPTGVRTRLLVIEKQ